MFPKILLGVCALVAASGALASPSPKTYMVINLAERSPAKAVTYLDAVPAGGWSAAHRTTNMVFRLCEPGTFRMGCSPDEEPSPLNSLAHDVTLTRPFYFAIFPVTQWQCQNLLRRNPSSHSRSDCAATRPVDDVSWHDCKALAKALGDRLRMSGFALPTSAQWEYAARAGETRRCFDGDPRDYGRFDDNCDKSKRRTNERGVHFAQLGPEDGTAPVGSYRPNAWGIYDVLGNAMQWCADAARPCLSHDGGPETDPSREDVCMGGRDVRILRGGQWWNASSSASLAAATADRANETSPAFTCRLAWNPPDDATPAPRPKSVSRELAAADGSVAFAFTLKDGVAASFDLAFTGAGAKGVRVWAKPKAQILRDGWCAYRYRARRAAPISSTPVPDAKVVFSAPREPWFNFESAVLPFFDGERWQGVYDYENVVRDMAAWRKAYAPLRDREFRIELRHDAAADRIDAWVDGQFAGFVTGRGGIAGVTFAAPADTAATFRELPLTAHGLTATDRFRALEPQPNVLRVNPQLREGAALSLPVGETEIGGVPLRVWKPEESFDQGGHRETCAHDDIMYWGMLEVDGFRNGPEFLQYTLPRRPWSAAWVLCASLPVTKGVFSESISGEPVTGVEFGLYGSTRGKLAVTTTTLPTGIGHDLGVLTNRDCRIVGFLSYRDAAGRTCESPLWMVRQRLDYGHVHPYEPKRPFGLGFVGGGTWDGSPRSNVQVFGCTLEMSPVDFAVEESVRGNIFANDDRAETTVRLTATRDGVKGSLRWTVRDAAFRELKCGAWDWSFAKAGETRKFTLDLGEWTNGWYALDWSVVDADGVEQIAHEAAFTQLGRDTREAGFESSYAAWPQLGRHETNPDRDEELAMLHKAGFHKGVHEAVTNEWQRPDLSYTLCEYCAKLEGLGEASVSTTEEQLRKWFEVDAAAFRKLRERFPHLDTISIFHEDEPRHVSHELRDEATPEVIGAFGPLPFQWRNVNRSRYLNAYCRYMHEQFPGVQLRIANNSAASERVARLARSGFDLNLVDQLGSEVLAFRAMPELAADQAAPGTMWALRETGRHFGMRDPRVGASFEFVFRPERRVNRDDPHNGRMAAYGIRDYLVALGHGCPYVSSGHLEDCFSPYYDSDWGASGQCRPFPLSYPKRLYTGIATLTKVLDRARFLRRVPTGENTAYGFEFRRDRTAKDYAYAFWTPEFDVGMRIEFPKGAQVRLVDAYGAERTASGDSFDLVVGELPRYVVSSVPLVAATVTEHPVARTPNPRVAHSLENTAGNLSWRVARVRREWLPSVEFAVPGTFANSVVSDPERGEVIVCNLVTNGTSCAKIFSEFQFLEFRERHGIYPEMGGLGVWVRGNGSFGRVGFVLQKAKGDTFRGETQILWAGNRGFVDFHGWQYLTAPLGTVDVRKSLKGFALVGMIVGSARFALDPLEMQPVTEPIAIGGIFADREVKVVRNPDDDWVTDRQETRLPGWF